MSDRIDTPAGTGAGSEASDPDIDLTDSSQAEPGTSDTPPATKPSPTFGQRRPRGRVTPRSRWRLIVLQVLVVSLLLTLMGRLVWMNIDEGQQAAAAVDARVRDIAIPAPRGMIYDQAGRLVSTNRPETEVLVDRAVLAAQPDKGIAVLQHIAELTGADMGDILRRTVSCGQPNAGDHCFTGGPYEPAPVVLDTQVEKVMDLIENPDKYPGVSVRTNAVRDYNWDPGANAAHLLGYLGSPTQEELKDDPTLHSSSEVGRAGIEASYDTYLRGKDGVQRIALDRTGVTGKVLAESTPVAGDNVVSTVDMKLQSTVEQELAAAVAEARFKGFPADSAAAVVLDATNGDVLAAASLPTYDRKLFADGLTDDEYAQITANDQPLLDRTIQAQLAPASTFKPITTTAAAQAGFDFGQSYPCPSTFYWGNQGYTNYESEAFPPLTIADALKVSCNTVFFNLAAQMYQQDGGLNPTGTPKELVSNAAKAFGYGSKTGVDLVGEASGLVMDRAQKKSDYAELSAAYCKRADTGYPEEPDPAKAELYKQYAAEYCRDGEKFRPGDAINMAVGQGDVLVTPLQLARAYAAIGNGGTLYTPHVVKAVVGPNGKVVKENTPQVAGHLPDDPATLDYIQDGLKSVVNAGTAQTAFAGFPLDQIPVAGKTGTAEVVNKQTTSLFAGYAPADNPKYAVAVVITQAGVGGELSAPTARRIFDALFGTAKGQPDPGQSALEGGAPKTTLPAGVVK